MRNVFKEHCEAVVASLAVSGSIPEERYEQTFCTSGGIVKSGMLPVAPVSVTSILAKMCQHDLLLKCGDRRYTEYRLSDACIRAYKHNLELRSGNANDAVADTVESFLKSAPKPVVKQLTLSNGKKLLKIEKMEELDAEANSAILCLEGIISQNKDLRAEVSLLKEEVERLRKYEEYYKSIKELKL